MRLLIICVTICLSIADDTLIVREDISKQWENVVEPYKNECIEESGVNKEDVIDIFTRGHFPNEPHFKVYLKCIQLKLQYFTEDGEVDMDRIRQVAKGADLDILEETVHDIRNVKNLSEKAYLLIVNGVNRVAQRYPHETNVKK